MDGLGQGEINGFKCQFTGFYLGEIKDIVNQGQQVLRDSAVTEIPLMALS